MTMKARMIGKRDLSTLVIFSVISGCLFAQGMGECQKYILLTTQRSGSTWTCTLLDAQSGITSGINMRGQRQTEPMIAYTNKKEGVVTWSDYENDLSKAMLSYIFYLSYSRTL